MPSHPDRVRANYTSIILEEHNDFRTYEQIIQIRISRIEIASALSKREILQKIIMLIKNGVTKYYIGPNKL